MSEIQTIDRLELKKKLDRGDSFRLIMTMGKFAYDMGHIPGSEPIDSIEDALERFGKDDEIVVYCSSPTCFASQYAYRLLVEGGFRNVRRFSGGVEEWQAAGLPLEGAGFE